MKVLVTGLAGFTGEYLKQELVANGHFIVGLQSDLNDEQALNDEISKLQPEAVIHLAGISFIPDQDINQIYRVNLLGARNLLIALSQHVSTLKSVILASSGYVYGNSVEVAMGESTPIHPANDYAVSKSAMEQMAALWMNKLPICIVRPFNYTGVGQSDQFLIPKIVSHFKMRKPIIELGNLDVAREFGDVRVAAQVYRKLLERNPVNETINLCTGKAYSLQQVISICEKITGHRIDVKVNPAFVRANEVSVLVGDNAKLKRIIGDFEVPELEETLRWMLNS